MTNTSVRHDLWCKFFKHLLVLSWCLGLLLGALAATAASNVLIPLMRRALHLPASLPGLLISIVLPFLLSAYAVSLSEPWLLLPISALKAFGFAFCSFGVTLTYGTAGWLVRLLFLFSDVCVIPILFFYWLRHIPDASRKSGRELAGCLLLASFVGVIDLYLISPFLAKLIEI